MEYVRLGSSGLKASRICLGMMSYGNPATQERALGPDDAEPIVRQAVEGGTSLERLGTSHVDLYQIHRWDTETPVEETMAALHDVVKTGKARYIGASWMRAWQFGKAQYIAQSAGWTKFITMQNRYNLVNREDERELIPLCLDQGVGLIPYSPLARGLLAGNRERNGAGSTARSRGERFPVQSADFDVVDAVCDLAAERQVPPARIALAWLIAKPGVCAPIIGATRTNHVADALTALDLSVTDEEIRRLEERYIPHPAPDYS
jgi:aryl-alcohol dehydrogenase-like predicted oxidoreductase